jgi:hypothetical protein
LPFPVFVNSYTTRNAPTFIRQDNHASPGDEIVSFAESSEHSAQGDHSLNALAVIGTRIFLRRQNGWLQSAIPPGEHLGLV